VNGRRTSLRVAALAAGASIALAAPSHAFRMIQNTTVGRVTAGTPVTCTDAGGFTHWNNHGVSWYHNTANQGAGKAAALQSAMSVWTAVTKADHVLTYAGTTTAGWSTDGVNTLLWATGNGCTGNCLALTALVLQSGQVIVESDVTFNNGVTWRTDGTDYDTQAVAAHELGHSVGVHHTELTSTPRPTMYATYFGTGGQTLETDDKSALQCSACRYCSGPQQANLSGSGFIFAGRRWANLSWCKACIAGANVDVFRDGVKVTTTANDGAHTDNFIANVAAANYWVCDAGKTTWYDVNWCSNVITVTF
jgi:hypothetical protein